MPSHKIAYVSLQCLDDLAALSAEEKQSRLQEIFNAKSAPISKHGILLDKKSLSYSGQSVSAIMAEDKVAAAQAALLKSNIKLTRRTQQKTI